MSKDNNKKWRNAGLYVLLAIVVVALGTAFLDKQPQARETWAYSKLIDEVQNDKVETVKISADRTKAQVIDSEGTPIFVNLPNDPQLIDILSDNGVDISVLPQSDEGWLFKALSSLLFPIILLVGLFFLLRRAQGGPGSQAMNFGLSLIHI